MRRFLANYAIFAALALECIVFAAALPAFRTQGNALNILLQNTFTAILAAGMTFTILTGGIDLSVGSVVGLSGVICADALVHGWGMFASLACGLGVGLATGAVNGVVVAKVRVPPFIVTLAMMLLVRGVAYKYTNANTISDLPESFMVLRQGWRPVMIMIAVFIVAWLMLMRTPFGRHVYAIGGNREAAWLSGIRVDRVLVMVYSLCGISAGLGGILVASRLSAGYPEAGLFYELDAVTAVVVGGSSLSGGRGSIWGTLAGTFFLGILTNGLNLFHVHYHDQLIAKGMVLLAAASLDRWRSAP